MHFVTKIPRIVCGLDLIWFIIDILTKNAHFIPNSKSIFAKKLSDIYIREVVAHHGVPISVNLIRVFFTSMFWRKFHKDLGDQLHFCTAYHLETDG